MKSNGSRIRVATAFFCGALALTGLGAAWGAPATPTTAAASDSAAGDEAPLAPRDETQLFEGMSAPWRGYFLRARRAESLQGRLARCLAYPDLPGNAWPAGYGEAHCRYHFDDPLPMAEIARYIDSGDVAGLEQRIREIYRRHGEPAGEGVHKVFGNFMQSPEAGGVDPLQVAERWVALAPKSAYAALARAEVWRGRGWTARGTANVGETSDEAFSTMEAFHAKAVAEFRRAIALQPDLIDAYIGLVDIAKSGRNDDQAAFEKARALDAGCGELAFRRMAGLEPRWGGSRAELLAYAEELKPLVGARPMLANEQSSPIADYVDSFDGDELYTPATLDLLDQAVRLSGEEESLRQAANVRFNIKGDRRDGLRALAEMLQIGRFNERSAWADEQLGRFLVRRDPTWARRVLLHAIDEDPSSAYLHYLLGAAANNSARFEEAEKHYLIAAFNKDYSLDALSELSEMWLLDAGPGAEAAVARAEPFIDRLLAEHPHNGRGLYLSMMMRSARDPHHVVSAAAMQAFLAHADMADPWQKERADAMRRAMASPKRSTPAHDQGKPGRR